MKATIRRKAPAMSIRAIFCQNASDLAKSDW